MRKAQGYAITVDPDKPHPEEQDTFTCCHCNSIVFVQPFQDASECGGFCTMCMMHTCNACAAKGSCDPFEKKCERLEAKDRLRRAILG